MLQINKINNLVSSLYTNKKYTELSALKELFSVKFLKGLEEILSMDNKSRKNFKETYNVSLGWIDKIPLASFVAPVTDINGHLINQKVELGDFVLVYNHSQQYIKDSKKITQTLDNRALIVQAKKSKVKTPLVPITYINRKKFNSTTKELALLSNWPKFNLFATSRSKNSLLQNIKLDPSLPNRKYCGYYDRVWYFGSPIYNNQCKNTTGEIFMDLINKKIGQKFNVTASNDWDKLINELISLSGKYNSPGYLFGKNVKRLTSRTWEFNQTKLLFFFFTSFFKTSLKKKLPVLTINRLFIEGELANDHQSFI